MYKVRLSGNARAFIRREAKHLRERIQAAAETFLNRLREAKRSLSQFPKMGREKESLPVTGSMRLVVGDYVMDYDFGGHIVAIASIRHGRQQDPDLAKDEDFDFEENATPVSKLKT